MAQLAIRGHKTRGKEVIEILKMLGGVNTHKLCGDAKYCYFTIDSDNKIKAGIYVDGNESFPTFSLEEFFKKFPYKVGDKVQHKGATFRGSVFEIEKMRWENNNVEYIAKRLWYNNCYSIFKAKDLQPYQEEIMKEEDMENGIVYDEIDFNRCPAADKVHLILGTNYKIREESGEYYVVKKLPKNPKTYEECCKVLDYCGDYFLTTYDNNGKPFAISNILNSVNVLTKLLICRNAYWKIAGEEMGLGKPWEPDFDNEDEYKYGLFRLRNIIYKDATCINPTLLIFPTAEMRDTFYDNFKKEIEECKELL